MRKENGGKGKRNGSEGRRQRNRTRRGNEEEIKVESWGLGLRPAVGSHEKDPIAIVMEVEVEAEKPSTDGGRRGAMIYNQLEVSRPKACGLGPEDLDIGFS